MSGWIPEGFTGIHVVITESTTPFDIWAAIDTPAVLYVDPQMPELLLFELSSKPNDLVIWNPAEKRVSTMPNPSRVNPAEARIAPSKIRILDVAYAFEQVAPDVARELQDHVSKALGYDPTQMDWRNNRP
jgi:hypothetical protein